MRGVGSLLVAASLLVVAVPPVAAQPELEEPDQPTVSVVVTRLEAVLGPGTVADDEEAPEDLTMRVLVENTGTSPLADLELVVVVHDAVTTRSELRHALDRNQPEGFVTAVSPAIRDGGVLEPGEVAGLDIVVTAADGGWAGKNVIHPVDLAVLRGREVLDQVTTAVIHLEDRPHETIRRERDRGGRGAIAAAVVWPVSAAPWRGPGGVYPPNVDEEITPGGRLDRLVAALEDTPDAPVLLAPEAHLLEDLRDRADGFTEAGPEGRVTIPADSPAAERARSFLARLEAVVQRLPYAPVAGSYADAQLAALNSGAEPLVRLAATAASEGRARLRRLLGRQPDAATYLLREALDPDTLDLVAAEHLLVPWEATDGPDLTTDPTLPTAVRSLRTGSGRRLHASVADPYVTSVFSAPSGANGHPVAVQRVLAETAMVHLEFPSLVRPLLVLPPPDWQPDPQVAAALVPALVDATWIHLGTVTEQAEVASRNTAPLTFARGGEGFDVGFRSSLTRARTELSALGEALPPDAGTIGGRPRSELLDELLRSTSRWYRGELTPVRDALVSSVQAALDEAFGSVTVPASAQVTLTSERGAIPVTLQRSEGGPLRARVTVSSRGNLRWPERTQEVELLGPGTQTVSFDTFALGRGTFAVSVRVHDVTGTRLLDEATLSVRSTAISRPALIATAAVVVLLLLWGALRRRRPGRPNLEVVREPVGRP